MQDDSSLGLEPNCLSPVSDMQNLIDVLDYVVSKIESSALRQSSKRVYLSRIEQFCTFIMSYQESVVVTAGESFLVVVSKLFLSNAATQSSKFHARKNLSMAPRLVALVTGEIIDWTAIPRLTDGKFLPPKDEATFLHEC